MKLSSRTCDKKSSREDVRCSVLKSIIIGAGIVNALLLSSSKSRRTQNIAGCALGSAGFDAARSGEVVGCRDREFGLGVEADSLRLDVDVYTRQSVMISFARFEWLDSPFKGVAWCHRGCDRGVRNLFLSCPLLNLSTRICFLIKGQMSTRNSKPLSVSAGPTPTRPVKLYFVPEPTSPSMWPNVTTVW